MKFLIGSTFFYPDVRRHYRELVEDHLRGCPPCATFASSYQNVIDLAHRLSTIPIPAEVLQHLRALAQENGIHLLDDLHADGSSETNLPPADGKG